MTFEEYKAIEAMNASTLVASQKSMLHLKDRIEQGFGEPSPAMVFGTNVHKMVLEPDEFKRKFVVVPPFHLDDENVSKPKRKGDEPQKSTSKGTVYCKEKTSEFARMHPGVEFISQSDFDDAISMLQSLNRNHEARDIIQNSESERTILGKIDGVECKARLDLIGSCTVDLKTTADIRPDQFFRTFDNLGYGFRMAFYRSLVRQNFDGDRPVKIIAVESARPFDCTVYDIPDSLLDSEYNDVLGAIHDYKKCLETNIWPGIDGGAGNLALSIPDYRMTEHGEFVTKRQKSDTELVDWSSMEAALNG